jgi:hypothetical protein
MIQMSKDELKRQAVALKTKMMENQYQRRTTVDTELAQYLDDERIAIMLQNREFMYQLRNDKEFMAMVAKGAVPLSTDHTSKCVQIPSSNASCTRLTNPSQVAVERASARRRRVETHHHSPMVPLCTLCTHRCRPWSR